MLLCADCFPSFGGEQQKRRHDLRDGQWERIKDRLPGGEGHVGGIAADNRLFAELNVIHATVLTSGEVIFL